MGWEKRARGGRYYVRKVWEGGKCRSVYIGPGEVGRQAEREDREHREEKRAARRTCRRLTVSAPAEAPPVKPSPRAKTPFWRPGFLPYPAAVARIQAFSGSPEEVYALIAGLDVDDTTRALLRRKVLRAL